MKQYYEAFQIQDMVDRGDNKRSHGNKSHVAAVTGGSMTATGGGQSGGKPRKKNPRHGRPPRRPAHRQVLFRLGGQRRYNRRGKHGSNVGALSGVILLVSGASLVLTGMVLSILVGFYTSWMGLFISGVILLIFGCMTLGFHCKISNAIEDMRPLPITSSSHHHQTTTSMSVSANVNIFGNTTIREQHYGAAGSTATSGMTWPAGTSMTASSVRASSSYTHTSPSMAKRPPASASTTTSVDGNGFLVQSTDADDDEPIGLENNNFNFSSPTPPYKETVHTIGE